MARPAGIQSNRHLIGAKTILSGAETPGIQATEPRWTTNRDRDSAAPKDTKTGHDAQYLRMKKGRQSPAAAGFACGVVIIKGSGSI